jgi:hypothetical protein
VLAVGVEELAFGEIRDLLKPAFDHGAGSDMWAASVPVLVGRGISLDAEARNQRSVELVHTVG